MFVCYTQRTNLDSRRLLRFTKTKDCCDTTGVSVVHVAAFCLRESAEICERPCSYKNNTGTCLLSKCLYCYIDVPYAIKLRGIDILSGYPELIT